MVIAPLRTSQLVICSVVKSSRLPKTSKPMSRSVATPFRNTMTHGNTFTCSFSVKKGASCAPQQGPLHAAAHKGGRRRFAVDSVKASLLEV